MATWVKNQIAKQLAKFAKNLDPNSLSLKFFKGEGVLTDLELDEKVISDILEFPPWLHLSKVTCNRISAKVPWTNLKSEPLRLVLHTVDVQIVASETVRESSQLLLHKANAKPGKYGFSEKVVDGMYVSIETLTVSFVSLGFKATANISRVIVQSTTPEWRQSNNLRETRIKDEEKDEVINFKEIKWGTMRVHVDAAYKAETKELPSTPLRLITNNSIIRLVIKKRMSDCSMVASKLAVILDDILWVLTRSQILKLSSFVHYIIKLRDKHLPLAQQTAATLHNTHAEQQQQQQRSVSPNVASQNQLFNAYDLKETSLHLRTQHVVLHLCDDSTMEETTQKQQPHNQSIYDEPGAALQISLANIVVDHYPYHVAGAKRLSSTKRNDEEMAFQRKRWAHELLNNFQETEGKKWTQPQRNTASTLGAAPKQRAKMYESYILLSCEDYKIMQVTTPTTSDPKPFVSSEKESLFLPKEMPSIQVDYTTYYYTTESDLPVPSPNIFVQANPVQVNFDPLTCVWMNRFTQSVAAGLDWTKEFMSRDSGFAEHVNIRLEALMPKIVIPMKTDQEHHADERPTALQILVSQVVISNCRVGAKCSQADVLNDLQAFISSRHYADMSCFPNDKLDLSPYSNSAWLNDYSINCYQLQNLTRRDKDLYNRLKRDSNLPRQIWCLWCDQLWMEFIGVEKSKGRPITFVDAFPVRLWVCQEVPYFCGDGSVGSPPLSIRTASPSASSVSSFEMADIAQESDRSLTPESSRSLRHGNIPDVSQSPRLLQRKTSTNSTGRFDTNVLKGTSSQGTLTTDGNKPSLLTVSNNTSDAARSIRASHSDSDIVESMQQSLHHSSVNNVGPTDNTSADGTYAWGGPPPPYIGDNPKRSTSMLSLPPAYEAISKKDSPDPGPISKPPIEDISFLDVQCGMVNQGIATKALLVNIAKTIQIQLDHFQLLSLLRIAEEAASVMERVDLDNKTSEEERKMGMNIDSMVVKEEDSVVLNLALPHVVLDLILAPCIGIDPIQKLSLNERVQYEKDIKESGILSFPVSSDVYRLPVRSKSRTQSSSFSSSHANSLITTPTEQARLSPRDGTGSDHRLGGPTLRSNESSRSVSPTSQEISSYPQGWIQEGENFKEVKDAQVQAGDSLVNANLKPSGENQLISLLRIHANGVTVGVQSKGEDSVVKLACESVSLNELGNMKYGIVLDPRGAIVEEKDHDKQSINMNTLTGDAMLKLRLLSGPSAEKFAKGAKELGFADIRVTSLAAALLMSTIDNLTEFGEDEYIVPLMPFVMDISRSDISLYDDKPRRSRSATKLPPSQIIIDELTVERDVNGVIVLKQKGKPNATATTAEVIGGICENTDVEYSSSVNGALITESIHQQVEALIGENGRLVEDLKVMNGKVNGLHVERESLLKVIDKLQRELMNSNRENDDLQLRVRSISLSKHQPKK